MGTRSGLHYFISPAPSPGTIRILITKGAEKGTRQWGEKPGSALESREGGGRWIRRIHKVFLGFRFEVSVSFVGRPFLRELLSQKWIHMNAVEK